MDLKGKTTPGGWLIGDEVSFAPDHTGGYFSNCFFVERGGRKAFLKALDIEKFDISVLMQILAGFQYESELLGVCKDKKLSRVVQVIESSRIERDPLAPAVLRFVPVMVFELADGDIRSTVDVSITVTDQWRFFVLHQTTLALLQLHGQAIAHQDLKPSNVLLFGASELKLGDLGRSSLRGKPAPHDAANCPGALNYAPFEQRYSHISSDWVERRLSSDVFHLGCLTVFAFTNICLPEYVMEKLGDAHKPLHWGASYPEILPHILSALVQSLNEIAADFPGRFRDELVSITLDLCHPDPALRGRSGAGTRSPAGLLWLQRYVSRFDILEKTSRIRETVRHA